MVEFRGISDLRHVVFGRLGLICTLAMSLVAISRPCFAAPLSPTDPQTGSAASIAVPGWRPSTIPVPNGTIYSITHTVDLLKSDPDFAGMVVRCSAKTGLQIGFVLVVPLPPHAQPEATVSVPRHQPFRFPTSVLSPGSIVLVAADTDALVRMLSSAAGEVSVTIQGDQSFHALVPLDDFSVAIASLQARCS